MVTNNDKHENMKHNVIIERRGKMMMTGVTSVENFDDCSVLLETVMGMLTIKGNDLKVDKLNVDSGELNVRGNIVGIVYSDESAKNGFLSRLFR